MNQSTADPRRSAFDILVRIERERTFAEPLIDRELSGGALKGPDRGLLTELVYGVLRRTATLDYLVDLFCATRATKLERSVLILLRLGLYQIFFLDRIPVSAAVNETVTLAREKSPRASGLVNAVLRRSDRERSSVAWPDRERDPAGYIALRHSHPRWIVEGWIAQLGFEEAETLADVMSAPPPLTLRVNTLRTSRDAYLELLQEAGTEAEPTRHSPHGIRILSRTAVPALPGFGDGLVIVQDESSQLASLLLDPRNGERVLDACASPGGKATHLAQIMADKGEVIAWDVSEKKLSPIAENARRLGIGIIRPAMADARNPEQTVAPFDRILVDAPCSALGVLRRTPEGKWWKTPDDVARLAQSQCRILAGAASLLKPGGTLLYSTCSTTTDENESIIEDFLSRHPDFVLEDLNDLFPGLSECITDRGMFRSWPHRHGMDGFFAARLRRA
ncbi:MULTISPECIES: 16S rRNA (cytosine(967)-C(5))-methyltransferase RsmB [Geobacter]|uniref:16S rRNA (cytosine(967)-C(5))-methyltransferase RsmB n=1 Tax=Geobacter TaxID=28231 RepID=UPI002572A594|nr:16S rRNA (cytosine(967)-C(5))-methyltransferase RsmB [Geobacter sulfurreducens]BEH11906.1 16S rRNA (cytosine(967)-C(5))-methyltransferase RsmB [Geobacter sulfurreducens subsp. ethanolicus]BET59770.1 16S rRNA (cytosine(967)-C(5))-methyltransferase RsmB [Geobacter sp. 60473]